MSKLKLKDAFIFSNKNSMKLVKNFLAREMKLSVISGAYENDGILMDSIIVQAKDYEKAIESGQIFALSQKMDDASWINYYGKAVQIQHIQLAYAFLEDSSKSWSDNKEVFAYLNQLSRVLSITAYNSNQDDETLCFVARNIDYEKRKQALKDFIEIEGTGPFHEIALLSRTGQINEKEKYFAKVKK